MTHLLNLRAAIALRVWGTHLVRKDTLRVLGANLRKILAQSVGNRFKALMSGIGATALLQSGTATEKIKTGRAFSAAGMAEITELHGNLVDNLRLAMSVFLNDDPRDAIKLLEEKTRFCDLQLKYAANQLRRLTDHTLESIETSSQHLDLLSEFKCISALICAIAYPILESTGALAPNLLRQPVTALESLDSPT